MLSMFRGPVVAAALALGLASAPAMAQNVTYDSYSLPNPGLVHITAPIGPGNYNAGQITLIDATSTNWVGAININAWCIDLNNGLALSGQYALGSVTGNNAAITQALNIKLNALLNGAATANIDLTDNVNNAGLQVAIWKTVYNGMDFPSLYPSQLAFAMANSTIEDKADEFLGFVTANLWQANLSKQIVSLDPRPLASSSQRLIFLTNTGPNPNVSIPEPASIALITVGLAGIAVARRRRRTQR